MVVHMKFILSVKQDIFASKQSERVSHRAAAGMRVPPIELDIPGESAQSFLTGALLSNFKISLQDKEKIP